MKPQTRPNDNLRGHGADKKTAIFLHKKEKMGNREIDGGANYEATNSAR